MQNKLLMQAERYIERQKKLKLRRIIVGALAVVILFCTAYALVLPALTMEPAVYCGVEVHRHNEACYEMSLVCGIGAIEDGLAAVEHAHTAACYEERRELICGQEESAGHIHDESCLRRERVLICSEDHEHGDACYQVTETYTCGMAEGEGGHTHSEACYETRQVLVCDLSEDAGANPSKGHFHTEDCYERVLICEKPEHEHTLACWSDPKADVESPVVWERTVAGTELTGVWADDLLAVAQSQLGYTESAANYIVMNDEKTIKGYTRYGDWYGSSYGDWCAMFVSFCLHYAEIPEAVIPYEASCSRWIEILSTPDLNLYHSTGAYAPARGDIVFFDNDGNGLSDHVGIVAGVDTEMARLETIEGNSKDSVQQVTYAVDDSRILGYGALPEKEALNVLEIVKVAVIYTDGTYETLSEDGTVITLSGVIPPEADVRAFPVHVEAKQQVLCAYDISILMPDGALYEPAEGEKISVAIRVAGLSNEETISAGAYYIPEDSPPVPMETSVEEDGSVCFDAEHFSTYALMTSRALAQVYLNGQTGNDTNAGTQASPVKTFEKALSLLAENGTVYVSGTVSVSGAENWSIPVAGAKIQRAAGFTGPLVSVANRGSLTLSNLTMNGGCGALPDLLVNNNSSYSTAYAAGGAKAPLIVVNSGGALTITNGTVLEYNSNKPNTSSGGAFLESGYIGLGGAVYCNGTLSMTGGLIQHCEAQSGGGIYVENGSFNLSSGTIDHNYARNILPYSQTYATYRKNAGGGVYVGNNADMVMSGGTVSNNQSSREGGGISLGWLNRTDGAAIYSYITSFAMTGGTFTGNKALSTGGGLNVAAGREATISAGYFTGNSAYGYDSQGDAYNGDYRVFSGGGIYVDAEQWNTYGEYAGVPGKLLMHRAIITNNSSDYQGGGIAACPTGLSQINNNIDISNGTAIYNNTAIASVGTYDEIGIKDIGPNDTVTDSVLGGGSYNWAISTSGEWTNYGNTLTDSSPEIVAAKSLATVWITDNHGYLGGGIGNNGVIEVGGENQSTDLSITISKVWGDSYTDHPAYITVQVLQDGQPYGEPVNIYKTTGASGEEVWATYYIDGLPTGHVYTVEEVPVPGYESVVTQEGDHFTITNTRTGFWVVKKWVGDIPADRPDMIEIQLYRNDLPYGDSVQLTAANGWLYIWTGLPEKDANDIPYTYTAREVSAPTGYTCTCGGFVPESGRWEITNSKVEVTSVSAEKRWADGTLPAESVMLQLKADGQFYGDPVVLNAANNWFYRWDNLPKYTSDIPGATPIAYTIVEINTPGYIPSIIQADPGSAGPAWTLAAGLENGKSYLLVTSKGALAGSGTNQLQWLDVSGVINNGATPAPASLWTYNGGNSILQNGEGKYLVLGSLSNAYVFFTNTAFNSPTSLIDGRLSAVGGNYTRYFTGNFDQYNYGTTSTSSSQAIIFTLYTLESSAAGWGNTHYIVTNEAASNLTVRFGKYSVGGNGGQPVLVAGADLALYRQEEAAALIPGTEVTGTLVSQWTSAGMGQEGSIHMENLAQGTYYLVETTSPEGHLGLAGPIIFTADPATGQMVVVHYPGYSGMEGSNLFSGEAAELPVYNSSAYLLPETGGHGTIMYALGGILLVMSAVCLLYLHKKHGKRAPSL